MMRANDAGQTADQKVKGGRSFPLPASGLLQSFGISRDCHELKVTAF